MTRKTRFAGPYQEPMCIPAMACEIIEKIQTQATAIRNSVGTLRAVCPYRLPIHKPCSRQADQGVPVNSVNLIP